MIAEYLAELDGRLRGRVRGAERRRLLGEVADHLADGVADRVAAGASVEDATRDAVAAFGPAAALAARVAAESSTRSVRRLAGALTVAGAGVVSGFAFVVAGERSATGSASTGVVVAFQVALVALQVAAVAGAVVVARALARRRAVVMPPAERASLRRCAGIGLAAATVGTAALVAAAVQRVGASAVPGRGLLLTGLVVMVTAVVAAVAWCAVARERAGDPNAAAFDELEEPGPARGPEAWGEQAIGWVRRWPAAACALAAIVGAVAAYAHAETSRAPSGGYALLEAAAVVAGFVVLGRPLGLRGPAAAPQVPSASR